MHTLALAHYLKVEEKLVVVIYIYKYLFHPRYLHDDIFRYMTHEITHDISSLYCCKLITLVASNRPN